MANIEKVDLLKSSVKTGLSYFEKSLTNRTSWGEMNFSEGKLDLDRVKFLYEYLNTLPLQFLTDSSIADIENASNSISAVLKKIDEFKISDGNPTEKQKQIINQLHTDTDKFYEKTAVWIPFLAYQKGDVQENINELSDWITKSKSIYDESKNHVDIVKREIDDAVVAAREASASAGAAVFTKDFQLA